MIVAVAPMLVMQVIADQVIGVTGMRNGIMPATWSVNMLRFVTFAHMRGRAAVRIPNRRRELVAIRMAVVHVMQMAVV
jgi:hypothetical protein